MADNVILASRTPTPPDPDQVELDRKQELHREALRRFQESSDAESEDRKLAMEAFDFNAGNHMDRKEKEKRQNADPKRPVIELNRTMPAVKRVVNTYRQAPPEGKVIPYGDKSSRDAAEIFQGYIRTMNNASQAEAHKETALEDASIAGLGWVGVTLEYLQKNPTLNSGPEMFYMRPAIRSFDTPFQVYRDPRGTAKLLFQDGKYFFVAYRISREDYKKRYGEEAGTMAEPFRIPSETEQKYWILKDDLMIAEYWYVTSDQVEMCLTTDHQVMKRSDVPEGTALINSRFVEMNRTVHQAIMDGAGIREETTFPVPVLPLIPYIGDTYIENGIRKIRGMVTKTVMAANTFLDYCVTRLAEVIGLMPLSPLMVDFDSIPPEFEEAWRTANTEMHSFLPYLSRDPDGRQLNKPFRESTSPEVQGIVMSINVAIDQIKAELDTYDASLGNRGNDSSGRQTALRQAAAELGHYHIIDNAARAEELLTWVLLMLAPKLYNRDGIMKITDPDGSQRDVQTFQRPDSVPQMALKPKAADQAPDPSSIFDMDPLEYAVTVTVQPKYERRQEEQNKFLLDLVKMMPGLAPQLLPTILRTSDIPGADKLADIMDPQSQQDGIPPQVLAKMNDLQGLVQKLTQALHDQSAELEQRQLDRESRERIAAINAQVQQFGIEMKSGLDEFKNTLGLLDRTIARAELPSQPPGSVPSGQPALAAPARLAGAEGGPPPVGAPPSSPPDNAGAPPAPGIGIPPQQ